MIVAGSGVCAVGPPGGSGGCGSPNPPVFGGRKGSGGVPVVFTKISGGKNANAEDEQIIATVNTDATISKRRVMTKSFHPAEPQGNPMPAGHTIFIGM